MNENMYHYTECGLTNVWLANGYELRATKHGEAVAIHDVQGLHKAIADYLVENSDHMSGKEFRFLRRQLGMSQRAVAGIFECDEQTIALWEKKDEVQRQPDLLIRALYKSSLHKDSDFAKLVERLKELDRTQTEREICMTDDADGWKLCA
ncbi:helix-turn-helix domain-containing protein [Algiphilus aromaticivorans]|jgi:DNA-binding transcriptional regulator YiaG|uniref:helix-turn-helix domain-containing protein n=1 Tax=Algiphilus aromaticivorans TaxID=382454 RepID=UPI00069437CE|nr:transcriptional regulator [Algiphilus aromaticivorans]